MLRSSSYFHPLLTCTLYHRQMYSKHLHHDHLVPLCSMEDRIIYTAAIYSFTSKLSICKTVSNVKYLRRCKEYFITLAYIYLPRINTLLHPKKMA